MTIIMDNYILAMISIVVTVIFLGFVMNRIYIKQLFMEMTIDLNNTIYIIVDQKGKIIEINSIFLDILNKDRKEIVNKMFFEVFSNKNINTAEQLVDTINKKLDINEIFDINGKHFECKTIEIKTINQNNKYFMFTGKDINELSYYRQKCQKLEEDNIKLDINIKNLEQQLGKELNEKKYVSNALERHNIFEEQLIKYSLFRIIVINIKDYKIFVSDKAKKDIIDLKENETVGELDLYAKFSIDSIMDRYKYSYEQLKNNEEYKNYTVYTKPHNIEYEAKSRLIYQQDEVIGVSITYVGKDD